MENCTEQEADEFPPPSMQHSVRSGSVKICLESITIMPYFQLTTPCHFSKDNIQPLQHMARHS